MPYEVETGWVPLYSPMIGNGYGIAVGPKIGTDQDQAGDQFHVTFEQGDGNAPLAHGKTYSVTDKPPRVEPGEVVIQHEGGANVKLAKDKSITITGAGNSTTVHDADGGITHTDAAGGVIYQKDGKIYLGDKAATARVSTTMGPSTIVFAKV